MRLEDIRDEGAGLAYPRHLLLDCFDALVLFASGFLGRQDAFWIHEAGLVATCVDARPETLAEMALLYPWDWQFHAADVYQYEPDYRRYDLVSVDCPSGHFHRCAELVPTWCSWAAKYVVLGTGPAVEINAPDGWKLVERRRRSDYAGGTEWAVLARG